MITNDFIIGRDSIQNALNNWDTCEINLNNLENEILELQNKINKKIEKLNKFVKRVFRTNLELNREKMYFSVDFNKVEVPWRTKEDRIEAEFDLNELNSLLKIFLTRKELLKFLKNKSIKNE